MKKILFTALMSVMFLIPQCMAEQESLLYANSRVEKEYMPDSALVSFSVKESGLSVKDIKQKNDKIINNAMTNIKKSLSNDETIKTTAFSINPVYSYKDKTRVLQNYEVTNGFEVKLKDISKVSDIIKIAIDSGVKNVGNIQFFIEDKNNITTDMITEAIKVAKEKAATIAKAANVQTVKIKSINTSCSLDNSYSSIRYLSNMKYKAATDEAVTASSPDYGTIEAGTIKVSANADLVYYLK